MIICSHSHSHNILSRLSMKDQESELRQSTSFLNKVIGQRAQLFLYPCGRRESYNLNTLKMLRRHGYSDAFSVDEKPLGMSRSFYKLPVCNCNILNNY